MIHLDVKDLYNEKLRSKMIKMKMDAECIRCKDPPPFPLSRGEVKIKDD
jgi:hypothetical protein